MNKPRTFRFLLAGAGALAVAGGAVLMTAQAAGLHVAPVAATTSTAPTNKPAAPTDACNAYLGHLASNLKVDRAKLDQAAITAAKDTLKDQVAKGTLTQAQADKISARLGAGPLCSAATFGGARAGLGHGSKGPALMHGYLEAAASALKLTPDTLRKDLKDGQTLSQVAAAQKVSEDDFKAALKASIKAKLDPTVASGKLTQAKEDELLGKLTAGDPPLWNKVPAKP